MEYPLSELLDRYAIELRKNRYGAENEAWILALEAALEKHFGPVTPYICMAVELGIANADIACLEWQIREGRQLPLEEVGRRAVVIRKINERRVRAKQRIAEVASEFAEERVYGYGRELPAKKCTLEVQEPEDLKFEIPNFKGNNKPACD